MAERELLWFDNPRRKKSRRRKLYGAAAAAHRKRISRSKRKRKRSSMKGHSSAHKRRKHVARRKLYGAAAKAHARRMARGGHKRRSSKRRRSHGKRRHRITSRAVARRAGRQLRYRRANPPFGGGLVGKVVNGAVDASWIVAGKAVARTVPTLVPGIPQSGALGIAVQVASAVVAGYVGKFISPNASRMMLAGGLAAPIESFVKGMNLPYVSAALSDADYAVGDYVKSLPAGGVSDYVHDYPRAGTMGGMDVADEFAQY